MINADDLNGARTERMADGLFNFLKGTKRSHSGVRLFEELMVDLMGALIPGVLFNFSLMVCFVLPIIIYKYSTYQHHKYAEFMTDSHTLVIGSSSSLGGWFWFAAFLTFLILSYIAGHVFFRSDINKTDREDIRRRIKQNTKDVIALFPNKKNTIELQEIKGMVQRELDHINKDIKMIHGLCDTLKNESKIKKLCLFKKKDTCGEISNEKDLRLLLEKFDCLISNFNTSIQDKDSDKVLYKKVLPIIFPHKKSSIQPDFQSNPWNDTVELLQNEKRIFEFYFYEARYINRVLGNNKFCKFFLKTGKVLKSSKWIYRIIKKYRKELDETKILKDPKSSLLACYLILQLQNDSACSHWEYQSDFPYNDFYKFLLKRNELGLVQYVDWSQAGARTKNKINRMKIDVQLDYPDAYAIINKNESHIRMASSSWYVARFVKKMAIFCASVLFLLAILGHLDQNNIVQLLSSFVYIPEKIIVLAILPPSLLAFLLYFLQHQIIKFIHYQRLREIYFTLYIYHKLKTNSCKQCQPSHSADHCIIHSVRRFFCKS